MDRKEFLVRTRERAQWLDDGDIEQAIVVMLRVFADNLSEYGTEQFAEAMPAEWRSDIQRSREKIEHSQKELIDLVASQAQIEAAAADQLVFAVYVQLWHALDESLMQQIIKQVPVRVAHALRGARPGQKRGSF